LKPVHFSTRRWFLILIAASFALRLAIAVICDPIIQPDTPGYTRLAEDILRLDLAQDNGYRTPGYSLFLLVWNIDPYRARLAQMVLGLITTALLFGMTWRITRHSIIATAVGATYGLSPSQIFFENTILTEALTTFLIVALTAVVQSSLEESRRTGLWIGLAGILAAAITLVRPLFAFVPVLLALIYLWRVIIPTRRYGLLFIFGMPVIVLLGIWSGINWMRFGYADLSTAMGPSLTMHTGVWMQDAPDRDAVLRDLYIQHREEQARLFGSGQGAVFVAMQPMAEATGLNYAQVSKELTRISLNLIAQHPLDYLISVTQSWIKFWATTKIDPAVIRLPSIRPIVGAIIFITRLPLVLINGIFLVLMGLYAWDKLASRWAVRVGTARWEWARRKIRDVSHAIESPIVAVAVLIVLGNSILSAATANPDPRYGMTTLPLISFVVGVALARAGED
jgi:hypothetical protein